MNTTLMQLAAQLGQQLRRHKATVTTAESCTGGGIAQAITAIAGSSSWFGTGYVTYSNAAKQRLLGVDPNVIHRHGAVSREVVEAMAQGALTESGAEYAIAVSGIAGPGGGTPTKPVGTVWFCWAGRATAWVSLCETFGGDRELVREQAVLRALQGLIAELESAEQTR